MSLVAVLAGMVSSGMPSLSLKHGVRVVLQHTVTVEQVLLVVGEQVGYRIIESNLYLNEFVQVSPLAVPSVQVTTSGVPLFIPNEVLE